MTQQLMTDDERRQWAEQGYLHIRGALAPGEVQTLRAALLDLHSRDAAIDFADVFDAGNNRDLSIANALRWCPELDLLLDHPGMFGRILGLIGPYVQVLGSEIFFRYPAPEPLVAFHTDQGPSLIHAAPSGKEVQIKAQFFLTDLTRPDAGNFTVAPGSHQANFPGKIAFEQVAEPRQILAHAGDVVLFPLSLGHGVAANTSDTARISVVLRYGQVFCRPVDYWITPDVDILDRQTPRRRRLLGDFGARSRPGDVYGAIPDQLELIYGDDWSDTDQARADFAQAQQSLHAYETL
ncbi:phytanoyl-CoA dioxygenase family protein [Nocardia asiatica]|uniref:phytanoyl-CoA dioxygenase family protein n=1 Tax=Nocardia asiatica TaxID=209252 RepID=UPI002453B214|nr:phytanoyl-CoA dioxygenase family protein [Nocardia asiatica]